MHRIFLVLFIYGTLVLSCQKGRKTTPPEKVKDKTTEFQPTVQGEDYIVEESPRSFVPQDEEAGEEVRRIKDGTYIADVEYFNTTTGANVTYVTKVQVENGYLKVIKWPNGVWLNSSYFSPEKIRQDGTCVVRNIEAGYENRVRILNLEYY